MSHTTIDQETMQRTEVSEFDALPLVTERPVVKLPKVNTLKRKLAEMLKNPLVLVLVTWLVMALLLVREVMLGQ